MAQGDRMQTPGGGDADMRDGGPGSTDEGTLTPGTSRGAASGTGASGATTGSAAAGGGAGQPADESLDDDEIVPS